MAKRTSEQIYEEAERAAIGDAIADTEQEIFDDALNLDPADNDGDRSLEEIDGEDVIDEDEIEGESEEEETGEAEGEEDGEGEAEEPPLLERIERARQDDRQPDRRGVPPARLREEADARRVAEAEARELRARLDALEARQRQQNDAPAPRERQQNEPPDIFADPDGRLAWERNQVAQQFEEKRINASFADAEDQHGEKFVTAFQALQGTRNPNLVSEIINAPNPGKSLMRWHERQSLMSEIGNDPAAYRERVRQELLQDPEIRKAVISGARTEATSAGRTQTRLPPSLNSASGGTSHRSDSRRGGRSSAATTRSEEQDIFASAFED